MYYVWFRSTEVRSTLKRSENSKLSTHFTNNAVMNRLKLALYIGKEVQILVALVNSVMFMAKDYRKIFS